GDAVARVAAEADVVEGEPGLGVKSAAFDAHAASFDAILALLTDAIDEALLARAPRVRLVANMAVGVDNVDLGACRARGVAVTNTPGVLTEATADLAFALLLAAARRVAEGDAIVRRGEFPGWTPTTLLGAPVSGATLGIVEFGRIGQAVARRAAGFDMRVIYNKTHDPAEIDSIFSAADFVSLHCPLTPETHRLASRARLGSMKPGSVLVNTSRGGCVDGAALAGALALALLALANVVLTPHIGSADRRSREAMAGLAAENVVAFLKNAPLPTPV